MNCEKCQSVYDQEDAFCRKCGAAIVQEATYDSLEDQPTLEIVAVEVVESAALAPTKAGKLSRITQILQSESGKKLAKGAALVAVGVGLELAAQALGKRQTALARPNPVAFPAEIPLPAKPAAISEPIILESVTFQRIYTRTIIRRIQ